MTDREEILYFIGHFQKAAEIFTGGCCYWFAYILKGRFPDAEFVYLPVTGHFVSRIDNRLYDATGDVTEAFADEPRIPWDEMDQFDSNVRKSVERDVVFKRKWDCDDEG